MLDDSDPDMTPEQVAAVKAQLTPEFSDFSERLAAASAEVGNAINALVELYEEETVGLSLPPNERSAVFMLWHLLYALRNGYKYKHQQIASLAHMAVLLHEKNSDLEDALELQELRSKQGDVG
jgi:hypothetical protein